MANHDAFSDPETAFLKSLFLPGWAMKRIPGYEGKHLFWKRYRIVSLLLIPFIIGIPLYIIGGVISGFQSIAAVENASRAYVKLRQQEKADLEELKALQSAADDPNA